MLLPPPAIAMPLVVEFFGIPRQRAGVASLALADEERPRTLAELWSLLSVRLPTLEPSPHYAVNLDGQRFVESPGTSLADVQHVLILSADAGG
jgi:hypothetical protein